MQSKYLLLLFIFTSSHADVLYVKNERCITDDYYFKNSRFHYDYSSTGQHASSANFKISDLEFGYEFVDGKCQKIQALKDTGMTYHNYKFMMALTGLLIGFTIFISVIFIFVKKD